MVTWRRGREILLAQLRDSSVPIEGFLKSLFESTPQRVPGTAVFLTSTPDATPHALLHSLKHYKVLHEQNVFLTVEFQDVPWVDPEERIVCEPLVGNCWRVRAHYGFLERPDVAHALELCGPHGLQVEPMEVSYFTSREKIVPVKGGPGHGTLARSNVQRDGSQRRNRHGFLQHPEQPRRGARQQGRDLERPVRPGRKAGTRRRADATRRGWTAGAGIGVMRPAADH